MSKEKFYRIPHEKISDLLLGKGGCLATDRITVDGISVGYCYRENGDDEFDSGWRFFSGDESEDYLNEPDNIGLYDINTIANYDPLIIKIIDEPVGSAFEKSSGGEFVPAK